jgi:2-iminoacetate synthase ThiH
LSKVKYLENQETEESTTEEMDKALEQYPQMTEQKKINERHAQLIKTVMQKVKERGLESLVVFSEEILKKKKLRYFIEES